MSESSSIPSSFEEEFGNEFNPDVEEAIQKAESKPPEKIESEREMKKVTKQVSGVTIEEGPRYNLRSSAEKTESKLEKIFTDLEFFVKKMNETIVQVEAKKIYGDNTRKYSPGFTKFKNGTRSLSVSKILTAFDRKYQRDESLDAVSRLVASRTWPNSLIHNVFGVSGIVTEINNSMNHNNGMNLIMMIQSMGLFVFNTELPLGSQDLKIKALVQKQSSSEKEEVILPIIGIIDMLCVDREGNIVIADLKTTIVLKTENLVSKTEARSFASMKKPMAADVIQVQLYAHMFDFIAKKLKLPLKISYCALIYWDIVSDNSTGSIGSAKTFRITKDELALSHIDPKRNILAALQ